MSAPTTELLHRLRAIVGPRGFIDDPADMAPHLVEWRDLYRGAAALVLKPGSVAEVQAILRLCHETGTKVVPQGGNTGLVGGGIPFDRGDEVVLSLSRLNRVRAVDPLNDTITVEAGCILARVQQAAAEVDRLFPLRIGSEGTCQIGGNLSTNAGGTAVLHYGNMRDLVLGLEVVLADGTLWNGLRGLRKDNTGYDLKQLFIGGEGTLGIITAAVLKLFPRPRDRQVAIAAVRDIDASVELLALAKGLSGNQVTGFEILPRIGIEFVLRHVPGTQDPLQRAHEWQVLIELSGGEADGSLSRSMERILELGFEKGLVVDAVIATSETQADAFWKIRDAMSEAQKPEGGSIKHDVSVPVSKMPVFIREASAAVAARFPGARIVAFGHIGDGNVHFNISQPVGADRAAFLSRWSEANELVHDIVAGFDGSISAEHGLGRMKVEEIKRYKSPVELDLMRRIRKALDPKGILNPGKVTD